MSSIDSIACGYTNVRLKSSNVKLAWKVSILSAHTHCPVICCSNHTIPNSLQHNTTTQIILYTNNSFISFLLTSLVSPSLNPSFSLSRLAMRVSAVVLVFALLAVCVSAVPVPYKWCGSSSDDATLTSIVSNEFPPVKGDTLSLNVTGQSEQGGDVRPVHHRHHSGRLPLPDLTGDIDSFRPLPLAGGRPQLHLLAGNTQRRSVRQLQRQDKRSRPETALRYFAYQSHSHSRQ